MPARHKLNAAALNGAAAVAALIGAFTGSWTVFCIAAAVLVVGALVAGDIRPTSRRR